MPKTLRTTAATMGPEHLPERGPGKPKARPEEFLNDIDLAGYYKREAGKFKKGDPGRVEAVERALRAAAAAEVAKLRIALAREAEEDEE